MKISTDSILFGAAYYYEYLPYERMEEDMQMMKNAGMNTIRIAESTWSTLEPSDNVFDFTSLDLMLDASEKYQMNVIIGTPSYAIPSWLSKKHPDILAITHHGEELYGRRQNIDLANPHYLFHVSRVVRAMLEHIKDRSTILGFQIDNETNHYDTCTNYAQQKFMEYLKEKFCSLEELNQEFGLAYWSNSIHNWEDFPNVRGTINASLGAEYEKFQRKLVTEFLNLQAAIIKEYKKEHQFLTQNFDCEWRGASFGLKPSVNQFDAARCLDIAGIDIYHPTQDHLTGAEISFGGAIARSLKQDNYLLLETQAQGQPAWLPYEGQLRLQAYSHLACGADSVMYWHFSSIHNSFETYWKGLLSHDYSENPTYLEAANIGKELSLIGTRVRHLDKTCRVAFLLSNESLTGLEWFPISKDLKYNDIFRWLHDAFYRLNLECDILSSDSESFHQYSLLVIPALYSASEKTLERITEYVSNGGHVLMTLKSAFSNENLKVYHDKQPHLLTDCFGFTYNQFTIPDKTYLNFQEDTYEAKEWMELLSVTTAKEWVTYQHPFWNKYSAITHNQYGSGTATYLGTYFDSKLLEIIIRKLCMEIHINLPNFSFPLIRKEGTNSFGNQIIYFLNFSGETQTIVYEDLPGTLLLEDRKIHNGEALSLSPWGVAIIEIKKSILK